MIFLFIQNGAANRFLDSFGVFMKGLDAKDNVKVCVYGFSFVMLSYCTIQYNRVIVNEFYKLYKQCGMGVTVKDQWYAVRYPHPCNGHTMHADCLLYVNELCTCFPSLLRNRSGIV